MALTKKQKEILDYIADFTKNKGYAPTQKEIKDQFNLKSFGSVSRYVKYLIQDGHLRGDWNARRGLAVTTVQSINESTIDIPLLGQVAAGNPIEAIEQSDEMITVSQDLINSRDRHFALRVKGDSMIEEGIKERDLLICKVSQHATNGQIVVAIVNGEATVKYFHKSSREIELRAANSAYRPIVITQGEFHLAGIVVGLIRKF